MSVYGTYCERALLIPARPTRTVAPVTLRTKSVVNILSAKRACESSQRKRSTDHCVGKYHMRERGAAGVDGAGKGSGLENRRTRWGARRLVRSCVEAKQRRARRSWLSAGSVLGVETMLCGFWCDSGTGKGDATYAYWKIQEAYLVRRYSCEELHISIHSARLFDE